MGERQDNILADFTSTESAQFLLTVWANKVEEFRRRNLIFTQTVTMASEYGVGSVRGFQTLKIPTTTLLNSGTARQKAETTNITYDSNTDTAFTLTIDQHWYQADNVEEFGDALAGFDAMGLYAPTLVENVVRKEDATIAAIVDDFTNQTVGAFAQPNTEGEVTRAIQYLDDNDHPQNGRTWVFSNPAALALGTQTRFSSRDFTGASPVDTGSVKRLYDIPILQSTAVEGTNAGGHDNGLMHRSWAVHHRVGNRPRTRTFSDIDSFSERMAVSQIWGNARLRTTSAVHVKGP